MEPHIDDPAVMGRVHLVSGSQAGITLLSSASVTSEQVCSITVGNLIGIRTAGTTIVGVVTSISSSNSPQSGTACSVDLFGEIFTGPNRAPSYRRGVTSYPKVGHFAYALSEGDLTAIFRCPGESTITIGKLRQDETVSAHIKVDELLKKHFAVLGSTGVGKSSGVALLVREILKSKPDLRVLFVDPHNEYGSCFAPHADVIRPSNLRLPFWLFNFEEFVDVLFRGRPGVEEEVDILAELVPLARAQFASSRNSLDRAMLKRPDLKSTGFSVDTPVPYRLVDLVALIEERRGKLENRALVFNYTRLLSRIEHVRSDQRYAFMFDSANVGGDSMVEVVSELFKYPGNGRSVTVMQLAGFPAEVVDSVVSVVCRMAFELGLWSDGNLPMLLVCEEAHRYAPADRTMGFGPTRKALSRIAKEGRKYGIYLGLVTQRAAELDATILSQCSTVFAMRMTNECDQAILRAAVPDAAANLLSFVPSLGLREALGFGEGMPLPTRIRFAEMPAHLLPRSDATGCAAFSASGVDHSYIASIVERWRGPGVKSLQPNDGLVAASPIKSPLDAHRSPPPLLHEEDFTAPSRSTRYQPRFGSR